MKGLAILKDSFRETLDCKTFWILLVFSTLVILFCWSVSFSELTPEETLEDITNGFNVVRPWPPISPDKETYEVDFRVEDVQRDDEGGYSFRLVADPATEFHRVVRHQLAMTRKLMEHVNDPVPEADLPVDFDTQVRFIKMRLRGEQMKRITVEEAKGSEGELAFQIQLQPWNDWSLGGAHRAYYLFGLWSHRTAEGGGAALVGFIQIVMTHVFANFFGVPIAIIFTAFFIPDMLRKGRVDTLISRPISRSALLLWKFAGGNLYVTLNVTYLIGGSWFALAVRSGNWDTSFLWAIATMGGSFAVIYAFSTWLAVLTRNAVVSLLCSLGMWAFAVVVGIVRSIGNTANYPDGFRSVVGMLHAILPKSFDLYVVNSYLIGQGNFGSEMMASAPNAAPPEWTLLLVSSGAFLVLFLSLSCITFSRKDY